MNDKKFMYEHATLLAASKLIRDTLKSMSSNNNDSLHKLCKIAYDLESFICDTSEGWK